MKVDAESAGSAASSGWPVSVGKRIAPPGVSGLWVFIFADVCAFSLFFLLFSQGRALKPELFETSRHALSPELGLVNTLCLLTSSWMMASAVEAVRDHDRRAALRRLSLTMGIGSVFFFTKVFEYAEKISAGISMLTNDFFMYYFIFTGIHFLHYLVGMVVLMVMWRLLRCEGPTARSELFIESAGCYWHMVDLLWLMLYPLLYLMRAA